MESLPQFYSEKSVAITGGTSFVGLCIIEKLLRSCPNINTIFVFLHQKTDFCDEERLGDIISSKVFDNLRMEQSCLTSKFVPITYDLTHPQLDIDNCLLDRIKNEVNVFYHCASTNKFDEYLRKAFQINCIGTRNIIRLCKQITNLEAICHLSSAYAFCDRSLIGERIYSTGYDFDKLNETLGWLNNEMVHDLTPSMINKRPNSYTLTKALAEEIISKEASNLPVCIVRPGNIGVAINEPTPGWCPNTTDASSLLFAFGNGLIKPMWCASEMLKFEIIPVDYVVNAMISAAWKTCNCLMPGRMPQVYNLSVSNESGYLDYNRADSRRRKSIKHHAEMFIDYPVDSINLISKLDILTFKSNFQLSNFVLQITPKVCCTVLLKIFGLQHYTGPMEMQTSIIASMKMLKYLSENQWIWNVKNTVELRSEMTEEDKKMFYFDPKQINWHEYAKMYANGTRKFNYNDHPCRKIHFRNRMKYLKALFNGAAIIFLCKFIYKSKKLTSLYNMMMKYMKNVILPVLALR